jgi:hypothetical protein
MDINKGQVKQAVHRLIDEGKWDEARRLLSAVESKLRNESFISEAIVEADKAAQMRPATIGVDIGAGFNPIVVTRSDVFKEFKSAIEAVHDLSVKVTGGGFVLRGKDGSVVFDSAMSYSSVPVVFVLKAEEKLSAAMTENAVHAAEPDAASVASDGSE